MKIKLLYLLFFIGVFAYSQDEKVKKDPDKYYNVDITYFKGSLLAHNDDILHLINGHPEGYVLSWNRKTFGDKEWEKWYNYPEYGMTYSLQNLKNKDIGFVYSLYAHYNFYFLNRNLMFRVAQGLGYVESTYNKELNYRNVAFGTHVVGSTLAMLNYRKDYIIGKVGVLAGLTFIHYSNANVKAPNIGTNTLAANIGLTYNFDMYDDVIKPVHREYPKAKELDSLRLNVTLRGGINESDFVATGQFPYITLSGTVSKPITIFNNVHLGVDIFIPKFVKELIKFKSASYPEEHVDPSLDYKRLGINIGNELILNKTSIITQVGYYIYMPYKIENQYYFRLGIQHYFKNSKKWYASATMVTHGFRAEALEIGIGKRFKL